MCVSLCEWNSYFESKRRQCNFFMHDPLQRMSVMLQSCLTMVFTYVCAGNRGQESEHYQTPLDRSQICNWVFPTSGKSYFMEAYLIFA